MNLQSGIDVAAQVSLDSGLFAAAERCLACCDPGDKTAMTAEVADAFVNGRLDLYETEPVQPIGSPGRPVRPNLIDLRALPQRKLGSSEGRACLLHAIAHIEFNAINLAWDAVYRFRGMPRKYYCDWVSVAADEARHFSLIRSRMSELGYAYGDFDAHNGLWEMAVKTANSCLERMALVPRVLEARGLDVTPGMIARLIAVNDRASAAVLEVILREEVAHVEIGSRWFNWCCERDGLTPIPTFTGLVEHYFGMPLRGPLNREARLRAGFSSAELDLLTAVVV